MTATLLSCNVILPGEGFGRLTRDVREALERQVNSISFKKGVDYRPPWPEGMRWLDEIGLTGLIIIVSFRRDRESMIWQDDGRLLVNVTEPSPRVADLSAWEDALARGLARALNLVAVECGAVSFPLPGGEVRAVDQAQWIGAGQATAAVSWGQAWDALGLVRIRGVDGFRDHMEDQLPSDREALAKGCLEVLSRWAVVGDGDLIHAASLIWLGQKGYQAALNNPETYIDAFPSGDDDPEELLILIESWAA